jgi:hypothetical protein
MDFLMHGTLTLQDKKYIAQCQFDAYLLSPNDLRVAIYDEMPVMTSIQFCSQTRRRSQLRAHAYREILATKSKTA